MQFFDRTKFHQILDVGVQGVMYAYGLLDYGVFRELWALGLWASGLCWGSGSYGVLGAWVCSWADGGHLMGVNEGLSKLDFIFYVI